MLQPLLEAYARRAREFSDAVACLGRHQRIGPETLKLMQEIKKRLALCDAAAAALDRYISAEETPRR
jgi:hypothetical protein